MSKMNNFEGCVFGRTNKKTHNNMYDYLLNNQSNVISLLSSYLAYSADGIDAYAYYCCY